MNHIKNRKDIPIIILWMIFLSFFLNSCEKKKTANINSKQSIDSIIQEAQDSVNTNFELSRSLLKKAMRIAPDSMTYYKAFDTYLLTYAAINQDDSVALYSRKIICFCKRQPMSPQLHHLLASCNNNIGIFFLLMNKPDSAITYNLEAINQYELAKETARLPDAFINLADLYSKKADYAMSAFYYRKALAKSDSLGITNKMGFPIYFGLGGIYMQLHDFNLSDRYYRLAEKTYEKRTLSEKYVYCTSRGNYYYYKEDYAKALLWFKKALGLVSAGDHPLDINLCYLNLSDIYLNLNRLDSVPYFLDRSYSFFSKSENKTALYYINAIRIGLSVKKGNKVLNPQLIKETENSLDIEPNIVSIRNKYLQQYFSKKKDYKQAYDYQSKNILINDSIRNYLTDKKIAEIDMRYKQDTTLMNNKLFIQKQASQMKDLRLKSYIWILVCLIAVTAVLFIYLYMSKKKKMEKMKYYTDLTKLRMENIRNRMSPHFIFNILNNEINSLDKNERKNLFTLVSLMRKNLEISEKTSITLAEELDFVKSYIELEQKKLGDNFHLKWNIDEHIDLTNTYVLTMSIQIPVENAIKHALIPKADEKILSINVEKDNENIIVCIRDNGAGYFPKLASKAKGTGTGLKVLFQSLQILNAKNTNKLLLTIQNIHRDNIVCGTEVKLVIPINYKF
jgi:tetratricopeptide (TPR) repeat protein